MTNNLIFQLVCCNCCCQWVNFSLSPKPECHIITLKELLQITTTHEHNPRLFRDHPEHKNGTQREHSLHWRSTSGHPRHAFTSFGTDGARVQYCGHWCWFAREMMRNKPYLLELTPGNKIFHFSHRPYHCLVHWCYAEKKL